MKKKKVTKVKINSNRPVEVNYIGNGMKHTARYADTTIYDLYLFQDRINHDQHQSAEWLHSIALRSNIKLTVQSFLSNPNRLSNSGVAGTSERSAQSRITLMEALEHIKSRCGKVSASLLEGIVIYNQTLSEWSRSSGKSRTGKLQMLQSALDEVGKFRGM
tara:strand:+ start:280 stop:762 length:483 start_codon:yes stop_codon:yes gene_type:complete